AVLLPDLEILCAVTRGRVHETRAGILGDVLASKQRYVEIVTSAAQRMSQSNAVQDGARNVAKPFPALHTRRLEHLISKLIGKDQPVTGFGPILPRRTRHLVEPIIDGSREGDRAIAGNGPRRRGPDHYGGVG